MAGTGPSPGRPNSNISSRRAAFGAALSSEDLAAVHSSPAPPRRDKGKQRANGLLTNPRAPPFVPPAANAHAGLVKEQQAEKKSVASPAHAGKAKEMSAKDKAAAEKKAADEQAESDDALCFICASDVEYWAVGECNHRTCHTCSIRLRALYKRTDCTFCKNECARVVFTTSADRPFESFPPSCTPFSDTKLGLSFETREQMEDSLALLRFNCPDVACPAICLGWADLKRHVVSEHRTALCDLCCVNKKIFTHEHTLFAPAELKAHVGEEHTQCEFCRITFYDSEQLYRHCRDKHEECFICVRQGIRHQYHRNYDRLEAHYKSDHFLCPHPTCLEQKFVVFETELDLQAHAVATHGAALSGDQRARHNARRIETHFTYEGEGGGSSGGGGRGGRGGGGGRRREEAAPVAAFVHSVEAAPARNRVVPGLAPAQPSGSGARDAPPHRAGRAAPVPAAAPARAIAPAKAVAPARDSSTVEKHAALMRRVAEAVSSDAKVHSFKAAVRGFRGSEMSAEDLVDTLWNIFDRKPEVASGIITSVADLLEDADKRRNLLSAWQDLRVEQNSFPSLAPIGPALNGIPTVTHNTSSRALHNPAIRNQRDPHVWARVERAAVSTPAAPIPTPRERFPALPAVVGMRTAQRSTPWSASTASSAPPSRAATPVSRATPPPTLAPNAFPAPSRASFVSPAQMVAPRPKQRGSDFPTLMPTSSAEADRRARVRAALSRPDPSIVDSPGEPAGSRWQAGGSEDGGWSGTTTRSGSPEPRAATVAAGGNVGQMQKKKKKEKVLLMSHGTQGRS